jgi:hypothetical protein
MIIALGFFGCLTPKGFVPIKLENGSKITPSEYFGTSILMARCANAIPEKLDSLGLIPEMNLKEGKRFSGMIVLTDVKALFVNGPKHLFITIDSFLCFIPQSNNEQPPSPENWTILEESALMFRESKFRVADANWDVNDELDSCHVSESFKVASINHSSGIKMLEERSDPCLDVQFRMDKLNISINWLKVVSCKSN